MKICGTVRRPVSADLVDGVDATLLEQLLRADAVRADLGGEHADRIHGSGAASSAAEDLRMPYFRAGEATLHQSMTSR
jgi:hypothetical protein